MADNNPTADPLMVDLDNVDVHDIDFYSSIQHRLQRVGEEFSTFAQILWGKQVSNFLDSSPGNDQMDNSWRPVRALGQGGFGIVGLWQKTGVGGEIQDEVAIKEIERPPQGDYHLDRDPRLAREAVIMHQLNIAEQRRVHAPKHILRLRSFKHFPSARRWRFFLEYAPHGDLHKLLYAYRAWDTYFPEEFLWHVFHSLAKAATIMEEGPFTHLESGDPIDWSVIHLDLKPENLYLAQPDSVASFPNYPTIKVADFGLSELTGEDDEGNPFLYRLKGTEDYMPPEQTCFTAHWRRRPDGVQHDLTQNPAQDLKNIEMRMPDPGYRFLSPHNIFGIGKVMYDMLTLSYGYELDEKMRSTTEERYYNLYNQHTIPEITTKKNPEYSASLRDLIRECINIEIARRPTPQELLDKTKGALNTLLTSRRDQGLGSAGPKLYYIGHEINHMPLGNAGVPMRRGDWKALRQDHWADPTWQPLLSARWAAQVRNGDLANRPIDEGGPKRGRPPLVATVRRDPGLSGANPRGVKWEFPSLTAEGDGLAPRGDEVGDGDRRDERENDHTLGRNVRDPASTDTQVLSAGANNDDASRGRREASELARQRQRDAERLAAAALEMVHPRDMAPPVPRIRLLPPQPPPEQQPQLKRKRPRVMGLSIDEHFREPEGSVVEGHNLRKRRR